MTSIYMTEKTESITTVSAVPVKKDLILLNKSVAFLQHNAYILDQWNFLTQF